MERHLLWAAVSLTILLLIPCGVSRWQDPGKYAWEAKIRIMAVQWEFTGLYLNPSNGAFTVSTGIHVDVNAWEYRDSSLAWSSAGLQGGVVYLTWPDVHGTEKSANSSGFTAIDFDLPFRYTHIGSWLRWDLMLGPSLRTGAYWEELLQMSVSETNLGMKVTGDLVLFFRHPVIGLYVNTGVFLGGRDPIEAATIGIGIIGGFHSRGW